MRKNFIGIFLIALLVIWGAIARNNGHAFQVETNGEKGNCGQCHTMTAEEAGNILYQIDHAMIVSNVMESPVNGLWEVVFENNGKKSVLYIPYSKKAHYRRV